MMATSSESGSLEITQVRSLIGSQDWQRETLRSLGLRRMHDTVTRPDRPEVRGMVAKIAHLVEVRYTGVDEAIGLEPGQEPKGEGTPPAGSSVGDDEASELRQAEQEALDAAGQATPREVTQRPASMREAEGPDAHPAAKPTDEDVAPEQTPDSEEPT